MAAAMNALQAASYAALKYTGIVGCPVHETVGAPAPPLATGCVTHPGVTLLTVPSVASENSRFTVSAASVYGLAAAYTALQSYTPFAGATLAQLMTRLAPHSEGSRPITSLASAAWYNGNAVGFHTYM